MAKNVFITLLITMVTMVSMQRIKCSGKLAIILFYFLTVYRYKTSTSKFTDCYRNSYNNLDPDNNLYDNFPETSFEECKDLCRLDTACMAVIWHADVPVFQLVGNANFCYLKKTVDMDYSVLYGGVYSAIKPCIDSEGK